MKILTLLTLFASLLLTSCATVKPTEGSESVRLLTPDQAAQCERLGTASAQVLHEVAFLPRDDAPMADELLVLAKNEAVKMGGNGVIPDGDIVKGTRNFIIYQCAN